MSGCGDDEVTLTLYLVLSNTELKHRNQPHSSNDYLWEAIQLASLLD